MFGLLLLGNLLPRTFQNRPIRSHCRLLGDTITGSKMTIGQCDQIIFRNLATNKNENLPKIIEHNIQCFWAKWFKNLSNTNSTQKILIKSFYIMPKWRNFAESGYSSIGRYCVQQKWEWRWWVQDVFIKLHCAHPQTFSRLLHTTNRTACKIAFP